MWEPAAWSATVTGSSAAEACDRSVMGTAGVRSGAAGRVSVLASPVVLVAGVLVLAVGVLLE